ncbi:hypothetical protein BCR32DRAFT_287085 [Anaeromyces robustus]|uniref:Uncharacterized protein n=1 Tax=Anaeromyces robustus TaxID=1754192 RepID=A0A1Y1VT16_9FUNG|nr:hypothetical protein BCR32DRAFT_287085 [Anaeromyces robustus]|eukprot:ORX64452.1 hypothetical protein BCR32DRAFT_287085 [Anaeromyces robustus]
MNFKTIFSIAALALAAVSANPVNNIATIKKECEGDGLATFYINDNGEYTCLRQHHKEENLDYRTCFFTDAEGSVVCVEEGFNNIPSCSKNSGATDYEDCAEKFIRFIDHDDKLPYRIRKFPTHEKIFSNYEIDFKECNGNNGVLLSYKTRDNYVCLEKATPKKVKMLSDKDCFKYNDEIHCVVQDNTSAKACVRGAKEYDHERCRRILSIHGIKEINN